MLGDEVIQRYVVQFGKRNEHGNVGQAFAALPFGDGFIRIIEFFGDLQLRHVRRLTAVYQVERHNALKIPHRLLLRPDVRRRALPRPPSVCRPERAASRFPPERAASRFPPERADHACSAGAASEIFHRNARWARPVKAARKNYPRAAPCGNGKEFLRNAAAPIGRFFLIIQDFRRKSNQNSGKF